MSVLRLLVLSSFALSVAPRSRRWPALATVAAILAAGAALLIEGPVARILATIVGAPSIVTVALLVDLACERAFARPLLASRDRHALLWLLGALAVAVYPAALGLIPGDAYRLGFTAAAPVTVALAAIAFAIRGRFGAAMVLGVALLALDIRALPSLNALDYLVDPFGGAAALFWAGRRVIRRQPAY